MLTFNQTDPDYDKPVLYAYFKEKRAVLFKIAVYEQAKQADIKTSFGFPPTCFINADASEIERTLGTADVVREEDERRGHYYLRRGIAALEEKGRIAVLDIFKPLAGSRADEVAQKLRAAE